MKKKKKYEDLIFYTLEEEIPTPIETGMLHGNDNNSIFISNLLNTLKEEQTIADNKETKKTQTSIKLGKVYQQMTVFSLMKTHQLSQIGLKFYNFFPS